MNKTSLAIIFLTYIVPSIAMTIQLDSLLHHMKINRYYSCDMKVRWLTIAVIATFLLTILINFTILYQHFVDIPSFK